MFSKVKIIRDRDKSNFRGLVGIEECSRENGEAKMEGQ